MQSVHRESQIYFTVGLLFAFDQFLKWLALELAGDGFSIIPSFASFELHLNPAVLLVVPLPNLLAVALGIGILLLMLVLIVRADRANNGRSVWEYSLIFGGGLSNLIDRLRLGATIDYVSFGTPVIPYFNLSDVMIVVGIILVLTTQLRARNGEQLTTDRTQQ